MTLGAEAWCGQVNRLLRPGNQSVVAAQEQKVRVLVVDDNPDFVEAAKVSLAADRRIEVVGGAANGEEAVRQAAALRPEVVAMDVVMPGLDGIEAARAAGASAYVVKSRAVLDLVEVVVSVARSTGNMSGSSA